MSNMATNTVPQPETPDDLDGVSLQASDVVKSGHNDMSRKREAREQVVQFIATPTNPNGETECLTDCHDALANVNRVFPEIDSHDNHGTVMNFEKPTLSATKFVRNFNVVFAKASPAKKRKA